jgi:hypothetical protein
LSARDHVLVSNVADDQLGILSQAARTIAIAVNLLDQAVEDADSIAALE